jgi:hypothetical protein
MVTVYTLGPAETQTTITVEPDGSFRLRGLTEGHARVWAEAELQEEGSSEEQLLLLAEDKTTEIQLKLRPKKIFSGTVVARGRPVPGAEIWIDQADSLLPLGRADSTDANGYWEIPAPRNTNRLRIWVFPPGWGLFITSHTADPARSEESIPLEVGYPGGSLTILFPPDSGHGVERHDVFLRHQGATIAPNQLRRWARIHDPSLPLPAQPGVLVSGPIHPGLYEVCHLEIGSVEWLSFHLAPGWLTPECKSVEVTSYGQTELTFN